MAKFKNHKKNKNNKDKVRVNKPGFFTLPPEIKRYILGVVMFLIAVIIALSFFDSAGFAGKTIFNSFNFLVGKTIFVFPLIFALLGIIILKTQVKTFWFPLFFSAIILVLGISGILGVFKKDQEMREMGGALGNLISSPLLNFFGKIATLIIFFGIIVIGCLILNYLLKKLKLKEEKTDQKEEEKKPGIVFSLVKKIFVEPRFKIKKIEPASVSLSAKEIFKDETVLAKAETQINNKKRTGYEPPPLDLLEEDKGQASVGDIQINSTIIKKTLENFGIPVQMADVSIGPTVTQYTLKPAEGVKLSKITTLSNDLSLALAAHPIRIEAPIPGKPLVGIEIPNKVRAKVRLRNLLSSPDFQSHPSTLTLILGRDVAGNALYADLGKMPHLLVAGATGTGKTICLNSLILNLLYRNGPEILRFILVDPKRVEFPVYQDLPHLLAPVIFEPHKSVIVLKWLVAEMERRFNVLAQAKNRDISLYNDAAFKKGSPLMPYIVVVIDELADLMAARGKEIESGIVRLAQMARAVGIHLIVATQRPSVEVITGLIKANITSRVAFQVASQVDSRTILDASGAEKLLGLGDLLYLSADAAKPRRIQGAYIAEKEVKRVMEYFKEKNIEPIFKNGLEESLREELEKADIGGAGGDTGTGGMSFSMDGEGEDSLYEEAKNLVIRSQKASASLLQRHLRVGYARAARLIDMLEERGVVGPGEGAKPREVYNKPEEELGGWEKV